MLRADRGQLRPTGYAPARRPRWSVILLIVMFHLLVFVGLLRAFAPDLTATTMEKVTSIMSVTITTPPEPEAEPSPDPEPQPDEGAAAEEGPKAVAREVVAPKAPIPRPSLAPRAASTGTANVSGAGEGAGTGAGGEGEGAGSGRSGSGQGGVPVSKPEKIAGDINDARDYPVPSGGREVRRGQQVVIYMTVGVDGRARDCRVVQPSPDPEADRITCQLAEQRFRFRPARDANGNAVAAPYGWRQRWF